MGSQSSGLCASTGVIFCIIAAGEGVGVGI